jgi:alpha-tubulin suppressor-like RCC1 family protein
MGFLVSSMLWLLLLPGSDFTTEAVDVSVGYAHGCALYDNGSVWCWGAYPGEDAEPPYTAQRVPGLPFATSIASGRLGSCAVDIKQNLWCWGVDYQRSVRANDLILSTTPFLVEGLPPVVLSDLGYDHQCAISEVGDVYCWGGNSCGEIGCGDTDTHADPVQVPYVYDVIALSTGVNNTCIILSWGQLSCWGSDNPTGAGDRAFIYESTEPLVFSAEDLGEFVDVANGRNFACGIRTSGEVTCWGSNIMGQLGSDELRLGDGMVGIGEVDGITDAENIDLGLFHGCAVEQGKVICWGVFEGTNPEPPSTVPGIDSATRVGTGGLFNCAVNAGQVVCWGEEELNGVAVIEGMGQNKPVPVSGLPD